MNEINVREIRKKLQLTQQQLADMIGVSRNTIVNYERGDVIPESKRSILFKIATSEGEMLRQPAPAPAVTVEQASAINDRLLSIIESQQRTIEALASKK